ncbi:MAG TPA: hypothetical protein VE570_15320 [Thermoleophilaceae bacterium]|nr:hypothetical protein [Thermoleophilaceae bacterium]
MIRPIAALTTVIALSLPAAASAGGIFGTYPLNISVAPGGGAANGPSSAPAVSGDNRKTRYAAFQSDASNLVRGDTDGVTDVFVWSRPKGRAGLTLPPGSGSLRLASLTSGGGLANGPSRNPSLDGSIASRPHCVAFESDASNMVPSDRDTTSDVFVRDLRARRTFLVSRGISAPATNPSINGNCSRVAFVAGGKVLVAPVSAGRPRVLGAGSDPDYSLDGRAVTWAQGGNVVFVRDGRKAVVGPGSNPTVTDAQRLHGQLAPSWGVSFDTPKALTPSDQNPGVDTYLRVFGPTGGVARTTLITHAQPKVHFDGRGNNYNGGVSAYATMRGIVSFVHHEGMASDAYYWNQHTGNADDTAHATATDGEPAITQMVTSARANFISFTSDGFMGSPLGRMAAAGSPPLPQLPGGGMPQMPQLPGGGIPAAPQAPGASQHTQNVYFKMLANGQPI